MGYRLLAAEEAMKLPSNHCSLGMSLERSRQITDSGMTFDIIRIDQVRAGSPTARAGSHVDDQIITVDGHVFPGLAIFGTYISALAARLPGDRGSRSGGRKTLGRTAGDGCLVVRCRRCSHHHPALDLLLVADLSVVR